MVHLRLLPRVNDVTVPFTLVAQIKKNISVKGNLQPNKGVPTTEDFISFIFEVIKTPSRPL